MGDAARTKKEKKSYNLLDGDYKRTGHVFKGPGPYDAALKAASRGNTEIYLQEVNTKGMGHIRVYEGKRRELEPHEMTEHAKRIGAKHKPVVKYVGLIRVGNPAAEAKKRKKPRASAENANPQEAQ